MNDLVRGPDRPNLDRSQSSGSLRAPKQWSRADFRDLASLTAYQQLANITYLAAAWLLVAGAITLFWHWRSAATFLLAFVVVSARQQALLNVEHDCAHGTFLSSRTWNHRVGALVAAAPVGSPYYSARAHHMAHHRLLGRDDDPDGPLHKGATLRSRLGLVRHFGLSLLGGYAVMVLLRGPEATPSPSSGTGQRKKDLASIVGAQLCILTVVSLLTAWWVYPVLWLGPLVTLTAACHLLRNFGEHALTPSEEAAHDNRLITTISNPVERFIVAPFNMNLHAEHHLLPWIPAPNLPTARARLLSLDDGAGVRVRRSYLGTLVTHFRSVG